MFHKLSTLFLGGKALLVAGLVVAGTTTAMVGGAIAPALHANDEGKDFSQVTVVTPSPSTSPSSSPNSPAVVQSAAKHDDDKNPNSCAEQAHARNKALNDLHDAWKKARHDLDLLRQLAREKHLSPKDVERILRDARRDIDEARHDAQKAIQEAVSFKRGDDEDNDDDDKMAPGSATVGAKPCPTVDTAKLTAIVDMAKAEMKKAVDDAAAKLATLSPATSKPQQKGGEQGEEQKKGDQHKKGS